jgi:TRAP-type C4-dicarboxylate transport system permease small subunit
MRVFTSKKLLFLVGLASLISVWLFLPTAVFANLSDVVDPTNLIKKFSSLGDIIQHLLPFLFGLAAMLALLFLIWGGIKYMMAQGDPKQLDAAKNTITGAIIGLVVVLSVTLIFFIIKVLLNINVFGQVVVPAYAATEIDISKLLPFGQLFQDFGKFITRIIFFALFAAALIFFGLMVWGGIRYLNSGGNEESVEQARNTLMNAFIGLLIVVASFVIIEIVIGVFSAAGVEIPNIF